MTTSIPMILNQIPIFSLVSATALLVSNKLLGIQSDLQPVVQQSGQVEGSNKYGYEAKLES